MLLLGAGAGFCAAPKTDRFAAAAPSDWRPRGGSGATELADVEGCAVAAHDRRCAAAAEVAAAAAGDGRGFCARLSAISSLRRTEEESETGVSGPGRLCLGVRIVGEAARLKRDAG